MPVPEAENTEVRGARTTSAVEVVAQVLDSLAGHSAGWWELREVLGMIGAAVTVDRVFVLENGFDPDTGMLVASMRAEWCADGVPAQIDNPRLQGISYEALGGRWLDELSSGRPLRANAAGYTGREREILGPLGVKSVLIVPLMVGGVWWGVMGFNQSSHERDWDDDAIRFLKIAGSLVASHVERRRLRINVDAAEKRSRFAMQVTGVSVWDHDFESNDMFIAAELKDALGYANEEVPNRLEAFLELVFPGDRERIAAAIGRIGSGESGFFELEHRMLTKAHGTRWFLSRGSAIRDANGAAVRVIGTSTDITDRKSSETAFRAIFEGSPDGMFLVDAGARDGSWTIIDCNERAAVMHGCTRKEMIGRPLQGLFVNPPSGDTLAAAVERMRDSGVASGEGVHVRKDGSTFWCGFQQAVLNIDGRERLLMVLQDVTERRRHDEERLRASKLEALGKLAGGIAHDFNNVLTAIIGNLSLVRMDLPEDSQVHELLDTMEHAGNRARSLAAQLLTFARGGVPVMRLTSLVDTVKSTAHLVSRGSRSSVIVETGRNLPAVEADEAQMSHVLRNLIMNADQAMPGGGRIRILMDRLADDESSGSGRAGFLRIRVQDSGCGIPDDVINRIFDPYFSTKPQCSGLGLATAYSIVKQHNGSIAVKSQVGVGSEFTVLIPGKESGSNGAAADSHAADRAPRAQRVLVMDDEEPIRNLAKRGLAKFGYDVVAAADGGEAVSIFKNAFGQGSRFDAVILDMVIPGGMGGEETIKHLRKIDPEVRVLAMSGYTASGVIGNPGSFGFNGGLPKPFTLEQLASAVATAIAG